VLSAIAAFFKDARTNEPPSVRGIRVLWLWRRKPMSLKAQFIARVA
jgi:hypothetical protein